MIFCAKAIVLHICLIILAFYKKSDLPSESQMVSSFMEVSMIMQNLVPFNGYFTT